MGNHQEVSSLILADYAEKAYLSYAMSVIKGRAIPALSDGQKPVQRRILFAMNAMGLTASGNPVKSARVVGDVIGKYHPHGDIAAYDAMVRMAQDFSLRYPLIEGIGNYGSRDGDPPAAMRYTEARLTSFSELLLSELEFSTVDFSPNYDGRNLEPVQLPARLPILLLNGASGIAVGLATEIPSHNLSEVADATIALIKNPNLSTKALMQYIKGPDFASGGHIINSKEELLQLYTSGKGSLRVRARYTIERLARGQWQIVVYELPQSTSAQKILAQIEEQTNPKPRTGKKQLSQEQNNHKALLLSVLDKVRDESDYEKPTRLVFEPKSSRQNVQEFINILMVKTDLELNIPAHLVMLGLDGKPQQKSLREILSEWIIFRLQCITRRLQYRLTQVEKKLHLLAGRMIVFVHLDEVITIIRETDCPAQELQQRFSLSKTQVEDILEIRLRQLAKLEWLKLETQTAELEKEAAELRHYLNDENEKRLLLIQEIKIDKKNFGDKRRTQINEAKRALLTHNVVDEPITLVLSRQGWIRTKNGHQLNINHLTFKEGDELHSFLETRTVLPIVLLDNYGQSYTLHPANIPSGRGDGVPLASLVELPSGHHIVSMLPGHHKSQKVLLASSAGYAFICRIGDMMSKFKTGKNMVSLSPPNQVLPALLIPDSSTSLTLIGVSDEPRLIAFPLSELNLLTKKGKGLQVMSLSHGYKLAHLLITKHNYYDIHLQSGQQVKIERYPIADILSNRGNKGKVYKSSALIIALS